MPRHWTRTRLLQDRGPAGVIPYYRSADGVYHYLLQYNPAREPGKANGWIDWGGRAEPGEVSTQTAARELLEETGGLLALGVESEVYRQLAGRWTYTDVQRRWVEGIIATHVPRLQTQLTECHSLTARGRGRVQYRVYLLPVDRMIPPSHLPRYEDGHAGHHHSTPREARWWTLDELAALSTWQLHMRLRKTRLCAHLRRWESHPDC